LSLYGWWSLASALVAIGYSLLMYKEFFVRRWLRAHLTTYAITHTLVIVFISITLFTALSNIPSTQLPMPLWSFSLGGWFIFTIFEFGRKTLSSQEERTGIDSYSKTFGRFGAVASVVAMALGGTALLSAKGLFVADMPLLRWVVVLGVLGLLYAILNTPIFAKVYRVTTMLFIIAVYATMISICGILL
jgi:4-hydroxybenzoate polyprenyltransferase